MSERRDAIRAVHDAAEALAAACLSLDPRSFRQAVNSTIGEPLPGDFRSMLEDLDREDSGPRRRKGNGGRHASH